MHHHHCHGDAREGENSRLETPQKGKLGATTYCSLLLPCTIQGRRSGSVETCDYYSCGCCCGCERTRAIAVAVVFVVLVRRR